MGFFDAVRVPPSPPPDYRLPEWLAPPENIEPGKVYVDLILASTEAVELSIVLLKVFPTGISFELKSAGCVSEHPLFAGPPLFDGGLGFGVLFSDGTAAIAHARAPRRPLLQRPGAPVLRIVSGSGGGGRCTTQFWLWPLPTSGPLEFVCEWAREGIPETRSRIDATDIKAAAARARELWRDDRQLPPSEDDIVI